MEFDKLQNDSKMEFMERLKRDIEKDLDKYLTGKSDKILFIWGPRRSGKTTLLKQLASKLGVRIFNFDLASDYKNFVPRREELAALVADNPVILIDEVQNYPESTVVLKILHDEYGIKIVATGSSELRQKVGRRFDSMAGRYKELFCLPLTTSEILNHENPKISERANLMQKITSEAQIWGTYPEVYTSKLKDPGGRVDLLQQIFDTYVLKDVVDIYELKSQKLAKDILTKVALQIGSEVSVREIAQSLGTTHTTVANYIEIFVKNYILFQLPSFKTNMRKAVSENRKLYFYDLGLRNVLVKDFRELELRPDKGGVFENFILIELEKMRLVSRVHVNLYFYREYGGKEIDLIIEDYQKNYVTAEIKVDGGKMQKIFPLPSKSVMINAENYSKVIPQILGSK